MSMKLKRTHEFEMLAVISIECESLTPAPQNSMSERQKYIQNKFEFFNIFSDVVN